MIDTSFPDRNPPPEHTSDRFQNREHSSTIDQFVTTDPNRPQHLQRYPRPTASPSFNQHQPHHSSTLSPHIQTSGGAAHLPPMYQTHHQSRLQAHHASLCVVQGQQPQPPQQAQYHAGHLQQQQQQQPLPPPPPYPQQSAQQQHQQQHTQHQQQHGMQRGANQGFSIPRTVSTPTWMSSANPAVHMHSHPSSINAAVATAATAATAGPSAPSSSSSSGSLLSYWDQGATSDSELTMTSAMTPGDAHHHSMSEMPSSGGAHHRYASTASLPAISPTGMASGAHSSSSHVSSAGSSYAYMAVGGSDYHAYGVRPASMSMSATQPQQYGYHSTHQHAPSSGMTGGLAYSSSVSTPLPSSGLMYASSNSSASLGAAANYDSYAQPSLSSQYVSYLPPALHDSRFYPLNPFEIKHRRRTTKTQFRVLESTFREIPKPNATLRKQISAQLDMPVRAVQIWFQNRRAKAKAMEKKRQDASGGVAQSGGGGGNTSSSSGDVGSGVAAERGRVQSGGMAGGSHAYGEAGEHKYEDLRSAGQQTDLPFGHSMLRPGSRSMDLPPLRMGMDHLRGDSYATATTSASSTPSTASTARPIDASRDRDRKLGSSLTSSMAIHPSSTFNIVGGAGQAEYPDEQAGVHRGAIAHHTALPGPAILAGATGEDIQHATGASLLSAGMPSTSSDRPSSRMSTLPPPTLPSPSSRSFTDDHSIRF